MRMTAVMNSLFCAAWQMLMSDGDGGGDGGGGGGDGDGDGGGGGLITCPQVFGLQN